MDGGGQCGDDDNVVLQMCMSLEGVTQFWILNLQIEHLWPSLAIRNLFLEGQSRSLVNNSYHFTAVGTCCPRCFVHRFAHESSIDLHAE